MAQDTWTNLNNDGRRLERIIKLCETNISKAMGANPSQTDHDLVLAYIDRLVKATTQKAHVVDLVLGISHLRKVAEKQLDQPKVMLR
jgi:hypothetical protein|tara:strand:+ start:849 stop:1109 length:261 start_codon:yes stop_codon:yes gene_type:complete